jgi:hypothetical protein
MGLMGFDGVVSIPTRESSESTENEKRSETIPSNPIEPIGHADTSTHRGRAAFRRSLISFKPAAMLFSFMPSHFPSRCGSISPRGLRATSSDAECS